MPEIIAEIKLLEPDIKGLGGIHKADLEKLLKDLQDGKEIQKSASIEKIRCDVCEKDVSKKIFERHCETRKHVRKEMSITQFYCESCDLFLSEGCRKFHEGSDKHIQNTISGLKNEKFCIVCKKYYTFTAYYPHLRTQKHMKNILN